MKEIGRINASATLHVIMKNVLVAIAIMIICTNEIRLDFSHASIALY